MTRSNSIYDDAKQTFFHCERLELEKWNLGARELLRCDPVQRGKLEQHGQLR